MAAPSVIQTAFHAGEWAPALNARVDLAKYHSAAALMENFFVDYRGGASTRAGTKYILQAYKSATAVRLIPFQASFGVGYMLEFGDFYIRFYNNGAPVLETAKAVTAVTVANLGVFTVAGHGFLTGDWVLGSTFGGMAGLNNSYYIVQVINANTFSLTDLFGNAISTVGLGPYTGGGTVARVYTIASPYAAADLALVKFTQNVNIMILCHTNYVPYVLTLNSVTNWTLLPIVFGTSILAPTNLSLTTTLSSGSVNYSYLVTAVDINGQESPPSVPVALASKTDLRTVAGSISITWTAVSGAVSYNVYKAIVSYSGAVPTGAAYGFIGNCTSNNFVDSNIASDFSSGPPVTQNPFQGGSIASITITNNGSYTTVPTATVAASPSGNTALIQPILQVTVATPIVPSGVFVGFAVGQIIVPIGVTGVGSLQLQVAAVDGSHRITAVNIINPGAIAFGNTPANPILFGRIGFAVGQNITLTWGVGIVNVLNSGAGYITSPLITFSAGAAAATANLITTSSANPSVPNFFQQRLVLAALSTAPQSFYMSQPGSYFNFNVSNPIEADDAISASIVSGQLNTIKAMLSMPSGLIMLSDKAAWLINGGGSGAGVTPFDVVANAQAYNGASDVPPIVANFDILYVQAKGSIVRDLTYNLYANIFTGTDISVLSSHLFYGFQILEWAWAEEPFKIVWAIRDDGVMLSLTFMKEQELIGWTHSNTQGLFTSVAVVTEAIDGFGSVDAVYNVVERVVQGQTLKYIERHAERFFPRGVVDAWCVDAGLKYDGAPVTTFSGAQHLAGLTVTGLADGVVIPSFIMPANGTFVLPEPASVVIIGLPYQCNLQTLAIDLGEPTVQGRYKKITGVTVRVEDTLGLKIGSDSNNLVSMKDLIQGNVGSATNAPVDGLQTADARTIIDPKWTVPGQYLIRQDQPLPATILGVIPEVTTSDRK